jgi:serine/threonine protein kinase
MSEDLELVERLADEFAGRFRRGGMGTVYEAEQVSLGRHVALKVFSKEMYGKTKHRLRFEREARTAAELHHTNIRWLMSGTLQLLVAESEDSKIRRREDVTPAHDWVIPEILRREAERLILSPDEPLP